MYRSVFSFVLFLVAVLGGIAGAQENERTNQPVAAQTSQQQQAAKEPLAVTVVGPVSLQGEKAQEPDWNKTKCGAAQSHDEADLCEQRRMAEATEYTVWLSKWQIGLSIAGFLALLVTIGLSRNATNAAVDAVKVTRTIGEAQVSAYLAVEDGEFTFGPHSFQGHVTIKNYGQSPAKNVEVNFSLSLHPNWHGGNLLGVSPMSAQPIDDFATGGNEIQPSEAGKIIFFWGNATLGLPNRSLMTDGKHHFVVTCRVSWKNVFGQSLTVQGNLSNHPDFVHVSKGQELSTGRLHVRNYQKRQDHYATYVLMERQPPKK